MADSNSNGGQSTPASSKTEEKQAGIRVLGQYVKDISFENPGAPNSLRGSDTSPNIDMNVNINVRPQSKSDYEVELKMDAKAVRGDETLFIVEVCYAGIFQLENVPQEHLSPLLLIECPRLLFPFARQIVSDATRQGGFPPLLIDPVDFAALYRRRLAEAAAQHKEATAARQG
jgi:preprotein translocase subunit SecB